MSVFFLKKTKGPIHGYWCVPGARHFPLPMSYSKWYLKELDLFFKKTPTFSAYAFSFVFSDHSLPWVFLKLNNRKTTVLMSGKQAEEITKMETRVANRNNVGRSYFPSTSISKGKFLKQFAG